MKNEDLVADIVKIFHDGFDSVPIDRDSQQPIIKRLQEAGLAENIQANLWLLLQAGKKMRQEDIARNGGMSREMQARYIRVMDRTLADADRLLKNYATASRAKRAEALKVITESADMLEISSEIDQMPALIGEIKKWIRAQKENLPSLSNKWAWQVEELSDIASSTTAMAGYLEDDPDYEKKAGMIGRIWKWYNLD